MRLRRTEVVNAGRISPFCRGMIGVYDQTTLHHVWFHSWFRSHYLDLSSHHLIPSSHDDLMPSQELSFTLCFPLMLSCESDCCRFDANVEADDDVFPLLS